MEQVGTQLRQPAKHGGFGGATLRRNSPVGRGRKVGCRATCIGAAGRAGYLGVASCRWVAGLIPISGQMVAHSTVRAERGIPRIRPIIDTAAPAYHVKPATSPILVIAPEHPSRSILMVSSGLPDKSSRCQRVVERNEERVPEEDDR